MPDDPVATAAASVRVEALPTGRPAVDDARTSQDRCPHGELLGWHCAGCLWGCGEDDHEHATECTCTNWCGESSEAGCCFCVGRDIYEPCPAVGFGCGTGAKPGDHPCDCCSVEQWRAARAA